MTDEEVLAELFGKFGLHDGDLPGGDDIQARLSLHLSRHGFENGRVSSHHNRRVSRIRIGGRWFDTVPLAGVPPAWTLRDPDTVEDAPVPEGLSGAIGQFLPLAAGLIELGCRIEAGWLDSPDDGRGGPPDGVDWPTCGDPQAMLPRPEGTSWASRRKLRLFACACCRRIGRILPQEAAEAVGVAERFADGRAGEAELEAARDRVDYMGSLAAIEACWPASGDERGFEAAREVAASAALAQAFRHPFLTPDFVAEGLEVLSAEKAMQARLLRDIFGDPSCPRPVIDPTWLSWNGGTVLALAATIYEEDAFDLLPVLADALEDAGCTDEGILEHLRGPGPHVRGDWVIDFLTGRE